MMDEMMGMWFLSLLVMMWVILVCLVGVSEKILLVWLLVMMVIILLWFVS